MDKENLQMHFVCTHAEAQEFIDKSNDYWVANCGCREGQKECKRSRVDVCLGFKEGQTSTDHNLRQISRNDANAIMKLAREKELVARPFRNEERTEVTGICFCCDCCCGYFLESEDNKCDKGQFIEDTDQDLCTQCGICVDVCYFGARIMEDEKLTVHRDKCYGCGLCVDTCATSAINMKKRPGEKDE